MPFSVKAKHHDTNSFLGQGGDLFGPWKEEDWGENSGKERSKSNAKLYLAFQAFAEVTMSIFGVGDHRNVLDLERCPIKVDKGNTQVKTKF